MKHVDIDSNKVSVEMLKFKRLTPDHEVLSCPKKLLHVVNDSETKFRNTDYGKKPLEIMDIAGVKMREWKWCHSSHFLFGNIGKMRYN